MGFGYKSSIGMNLGVIQHNSRIRYGQTFYRNQQNHILRTAYMNPWRIGLSKAEPAAELQFSGHRRCVQLFRSVDLPVNVKKSATVSIRS